MSKPYKPHRYQRTMINFGVGLATAGFFADPGLGKTSVMLAIFKILKKMKLVTRMLVIAPLRPCYSVWSGEGGEPNKWDDFKGFKVNVLHGPDKEERFNDLTADIYVINPEGMSWLINVAPHPRDWPFEMLVVDESTRFKHTNTVRFKNLNLILNWFSRRYILTGSPAPNGLLDLFGQIFILDGGAALGKFMKHYQMNYFDLHGMHDWLPRPGAEEKIYQKLRPLVLRMAAADYLDLEPYVPNTVEVILPAKARATYDQMERTLITAVDEKVITAANAAAATGKCRQIANGGVYDVVDPKSRKGLHIHDVKLEAVEEIIEELQGKPALVAYEFDHDRQRLQAWLKKAGYGEVPYIGGGVSAKTFKQIERDWNQGKIPVLLAQPQSVAHGLNLQGTGAAVIWHSLTWDLENYEQLIRRVWRQGQRERVVVHHIVAKGTIDEVIMKTIKAKDHTQQALLTALKDHLKEKKGRQHERRGQGAATGGAGVV